MHDFPLVQQIFPNPHKIESGYFCLFVHVVKTRSNTVAMLPNKKKKIAL
jgi:hypothetical protein